MTNLSESKSLWEDNDNNEARELFKSVQGIEITVTRGIKRRMGRKLKNNFTKKQEQFKIEKNIFETKNRIKKVESFGNFTVISNYNVLTIVKNILNINREVVNVDLESEIQDFVVTNDEKLLCIFKKSYYIKLVDLQGQVVDIVKNFNETGFTKIINSGDRIYLLGDKLSVLNTDFEIEFQLGHTFRDFSVLGGLIYGLMANNDILVFKEIEVIKKMSLKDKFAIHRIFCYDKIYLACLNSIKIYDSELRLLKEKDLPFDPQNLSKIGRLVYFSGDNRQTLRIMKDEMFIPNFPASNMFFPKISSLSGGESLLYSSARGISHVKTI